MPNWRNEYRRCDNCRASIGLSVRLRAIALGVANETPPTPEKDCSKEASEKGTWLPLYREASGALVREQIIARQHLENPITIFLPDGSQGRVWLATNKHGSKIIGDVLHWRVNVREAIRVDQRPLSSCGA